MIFPLEMWEQVQSCSFQYHQSINKYKITVLWQILSLWIYRYLKLYMHNSLMALWKRTFCVQIFFTCFMFAIPGAKGFNFKLFFHWLQQIIKTDDFWGFNYSLHLLMWGKSSQTYNRYSFVSLFQMKLSVYWSLGLWSHLKWGTMTTPFNSLAFLDPMLYPYLFRFIFFINPQGWKEYDSYFIQNCNGGAIPGLTPI